MSLAAQQHIPLKSAYLGQDCKAVGNSAMRRPACASTVLMGLAGVFGRQEEARELNLIVFSALAA